MNTMNSHMQNESGSVTIIAAVLILVIVTLVGLSAMDTTTVELQIAGNDQRSRVLADRSPEQLGNTDH